MHPIAEQARKRVILASLQQLTVETVQALVFLDYIAQGRPSKGMVGPLSRTSVQCGLYP